MKDNESSGSATKGYSRCEWALARVKGYLRRDPSAIYGG